MTKSYLEALFLEAERVTLRSFGICNVKSLLCCDLKGLALVHKTSNSNKFPSTLFGGVNESTIFSMILGTHESDWLKPSSHKCCMSNFQKIFKTNLKSVDVFRLQICSNTTEEVVWKNEDEGGLPVREERFILDLRGDARPKVFDFLMKVDEGKITNETMANYRVNVKCRETTGLVGANPVHNLPNVVRHVVSFFLNMFTLLGSFERIEFKERVVMFFKESVASDIGKSVESVIELNSRDSKKGLEKVRKVKRLIGRNSLFTLKRIRTLLDDLLRQAVLFHRLLLR